MSDIGGVPSSHAQGYATGNSVHCRAQHVLPQTLGTIKKMCNKNIASSRFKVAAATFEEHIWIDEGHSENIREWSFFRAVPIY